MVYPATVLLITVVSEKSEAHLLQPRKYTETYDEARRRETKYNSTMSATTELETEDKGEERLKRKKRPNPKYLDSDPDEPSTGHLKIKPLPRPPDVGVPGGMSNYSQFQETPNYCQAQAVWSPEHTTEVGDVYSHSDNLMPDPNNNTTPRSNHYGHLRPSQLARDVVFTGACDQRSTHEQVHN